LHQFNAGNFDAAANGFALWCHAAGKILPGLVTRRGKEMALFKAAPQPQANTEAAPVPTHVDITQTQKPPEAKPAPQQTGLAGLFALIIKIISILFARKATK
jgi:hypothetical protein